MLDLLGLDEEEINSSDMLSLMKPSLLITMNWASPLSFHFTSSVSYTGKKAG